MVLRRNYVITHLSITKVTPSDSHLTPSIHVHFFSPLEMVSGVEDAGRESGLGVLPGAWARRGGNPSSNMSWPNAAAESECELCCSDELAAGLERHSGVSLAGSRSRSRRGQGTGFALRDSRSFW